MPWIVERPERLDNALMRFEAFSSRAEAQRSIHEGLIQVNGSVIERPSSRLKIGDSVSVISERMVEVSELKPSDLSFTILYEDPACLVIEKPAGFSVHPGAGMKKGEVTILHGIAYLFKKKKISFNASSVLVHRLDKETTGCLLIAKTPDAHRHLQKQFADRTVEKQYLALVAGVPSPPAAIIDAPIGRHSGDRTKMAVFHAVQSRREARTGRTHQVRVHLKAIEHPVVGDSDYGNQRSRKIAEKYHIESLCLHAWKLKFRSPHDGKEHAIEAPLQENLQGAIHVLRISWDR
ncbi:MAG: 23S rRNA pseudouridine synthase [Candidatus Peregrinibacteria bacterium Greene1014_49]|nr:MAG: 23S rRNA pseudouridine synthase [Candidatus Peregrinibacteria bacterium Greene1014_49]